MKNIFIVMTGIALLAGCSSAPHSAVNLKDIGKEEVVQTYGKEDSLKESDPFRVDGGWVISIGSTTIPGDHRPEAGIKQAQMRARANLAQVVETKLEAINQLATEDTGDTVQMRELIGEVSKITANEFKLGPVYYEKVKVISDNGVPRTEYRIWAEVKTDEQQFKRLVLDSIRRQEGKRSLSAEFGKRVDQQFDRMLNGEVQPKQDTAQAQSTENRKPASKEDASE